MQSNIVVIGAGFAGVWSALSAKRHITLKGKEAEIEVSLIAPAPVLVMRPRLYEENVSSMVHPLAALFEAAGIKFIEGTVSAIHSEKHAVSIRSASGTESSLEYTRLILAAGSSVLRPQRVTGLKEHAFDVDSLAAAEKLESHLKGLASLPSRPARDTVVVCGGGFTGIELATELPKRLSSNAGIRVILIESANQVGPELGPGPRPAITEALESLGVEIKIGSAVASVDAQGVTLASGERIETLTVIWTAGVRANALTQQIPGPKDSLSRIHVDQDLRVPSCERIFATGDTACARADTEGHYALMSCQHALMLGRISGHNAAADLLHEPLVPYSQAFYTCCLDLGAWGAVVSAGWEREVKATGAKAKQLKAVINQKLIYPPLDAEIAIAEASPDAYDVKELLKQPPLALI